MRHANWLMIPGLLALGLWLSSAKAVLPTATLPYLQASDGAPVWRQAGSPDLIRLADANLLDQRGRPARVASLRGRPLILDFMLAGCEDICPPKRKALQTLLRRENRADLQVVSLVMNRRRVAEGILQHLIRETGIPESRWQFWQGADGDVLRYCRTIPHVGPRLTADATEPGAAHSDNVLLVDAQGYCRGVYHANNPLDMANLAEDLKRLPAS